MSAGCGCAMCTAERDAGAAREREEIVRVLKKHARDFYRFAYAETASILQLVISDIQARGVKEWACPICGAPAGPDSVARREGK